MSVPMTLELARTLVRRDLHAFEMPNPLNTTTIKRGTERHEAYKFLLAACPQNETIAKGLALLNAATLEQQKVLVALLEGNRLATFTQKEVADVATVLGDYLQQDDQEKAFLEEWKAELVRREAEKGGEGDG